ncbi:Clp protease N-terminal domain-containing protein [Streptomyces sp. NPDC090025]|uniref:Clp protease N-terminal domain-containing protein n=1 Tax=Streptomyces sp. NPDC090025 TaxID=3365922 RepID=UPI0038389033
MHAPVPPVPSSPGRAPVSRVPRTLPAARRAELQDRLTVELMTALSAARRRALRDGDRQIDTAHLLHSLVESDPAAGAAVGDPERRARVLGYLVQRAIGYGMRWQRSVEDTGASLPVLRGSEHGGGGWSPAAATALAGAFERAARRGEHGGDRRVHGLDLLSALAADPGSRAAEVLRRAGVDPAALTGHGEEPSQQV